MMDLRLYKHLPRTGTHKERTVCPSCHLKTCITCRSEPLIILMCCPLPFPVARILTLTCTYSSTEKSS